MWYRRRDKASISTWDIDNLAIRGIGRWNQKIYSRGNVSYREKLYPQEIEQSSAILCFDVIFWRLQKNKYMFEIKSPSLHLLPLLQSTSARSSLEIDANQSSDKQQLRFPNRNGCSGIDTTRDVSGRVRFLWRSFLWLCVDSLDQSLEAGEAEEGGAFNWIACHMLEIDPSTRFPLLLHLRPLFWQRVKDFGQIDQFGPHHFWVPPDASATPLYPGGP